MSDCSGSHRRHRIREPEYADAEELYMRHGASASNLDLVLRPRNDNYDRDYAPSRHARSSRYHRLSHDDDDYDHSYNGRSRCRQSRYDDDAYHSADYDHPPRQERRKSKAGDIFEDPDLRGVGAAVDKIHGRSQSRRRHGSYADERGSQYSNPSQEARRKWQQAAQAAVITGAIEAVRSRNIPGGWTGEKGQRIATAALGAGGDDGIPDRDPERKSQYHIVESAIGGLAVNHLANGLRVNPSCQRPLSRSRSQTRSRFRSRSRSVFDRIRSRSHSILGRGRSRSRGRDSERSGSGINKIAGLSTGAAIGKTIHDRVRSKSRGRLRRDASVPGEDSYVPFRHQRWQPGPSRGGPTAGGSGYDHGRSAEAPADVGILDHTRGTGAHSASSEDTDELKEKFKKTRGKEFLTAALASVATIHAAHGICSSIEASDKRHQQVVSGEMSPETARKIKSKNILQDAAVVGIAAMSIKSAFNKWKEMNEQRREKHDISARRRKRIKARKYKERKR